MHKPLPKSLRMDNEVVAMKPYLGLGFSWYKRKRAGGRNLGMCFNYGPEPPCDHFSNKWYMIHLKLSGKLKLINSEI